MPDSDRTVRGLVPVVDVDEDRPESERKLTPGIALCLSGGGYRAMLYHLGGIIRLNELGKLGDIDRVSSVSGGSITAGKLGLAWSQLQFDNHGVATNLEQIVIDPIRTLAEHTIDKKSIIGGLLRPRRTIGQDIAKAYDRHLYDGKTLRDLPDDDHGPRFVINATNVQTGKLFRFSRPYQGDYTVGLWLDPKTRLADAVAASSAFPPVLSPHTFKPSGDFDLDSKGINVNEAFRTRLWLSDGGVYDNLGLETAWKRYRTILVSDGGGMLGTETSPKRNWVQHGMRIAAIVDGQVRTLRKRQLIGGYESNLRDGAYWGIRSDVPDYHLSDPIDFPVPNRERAQGVKTRLAELGADTQRDLINWGYVIADTALRRWVFTDAPAPEGLPVH
ncbi:MAG: patatin-like phospholipase family protein [Actinomycetia bacterium]|nr:patatin-like phospholipase family protein [Actinomycetes bacterium]MCP4959828.1 patatin-like phospholipase family protein [Actinomycetes bacterium]